MRKEHLSDIEIQQYVFQKEDCDSELVSHIHSCKICRSRAGQYTFLFEEVRQQEKPVFDFDLAGIVMEQLPQPEVVPEKTASRFLAFSVIFSVFALLYFGGNQLLNLFTTTKPLSIGLIIVSVLGLFGFLAADMYRQYQTKIKALNF
jgi:hypothetical protein